MCGAQKPSATPLYQQYLSAMTSFEQKVATALAKVQRASIKLDTAIHDRIKTVDCFYQAKSKEEKRKHGLRVRETELRQITAQAELRQLYYRDGFYKMPSRKWISTWHSDTKCQERSSVTSVSSIPSHPPNRRGLVLKRTWSQIGD